MPFRFRPVDTTFYDLFAQLANHLVGGAELLAEMLSNGGDREGVAQRMRDAEHHADETTHEIVRRVNSTFVTPFDREDIYALASGLDDVMDHMEEAVDLVLLYGVHELPSELAHQVEVLQRAAELTAEAMPRLETMKNLDEYWIEINRLENDGDKSYRRILVQLVQRAVRRPRGAQAQGRRRLARGRHRRVRDRREHRRADLRQGVLRVELAIVVAVVVVALVFDYTNGFHDAANAIATSVSTRALTPRVALVMAAVMNFVGAFLGTEVAETVGKGVIEAPEQSASRPGRRDGRPARRDRLEPRHLVLRPALVVLARPHRRPGGLRARRRRGRRRAVGRGSWRRSLIPMVISPLVGFSVAFLLMLAIMWIFRRRQRPVR